MLRDGDASSLPDVSPFTVGGTPAGVDRRGPTIRVSRRTIRRVARERSAERGLAQILVRQALAEARVRVLKKAEFRRGRNPAAVRGYCAMSAADLEAVNARQRWANWRVIPRNLNGRLPSRAVRAIDLCCGIGDSTEVLAFYLAPGSDILGLEYNAAFVAAAEARPLRDEYGDRASVRFRVQSVLETFRDDGGEIVADRSVDLVNSSGAVGCHFDRGETERLLDEIARVLRPAGLATIDAGADGTPAADLIATARARGFSVAQRTRSCFLDRFEQIVLVRGR